MSLPAGQFYYLPAFVAPMLFSPHKDHIPSIEIDTPAEPQVEVVA